MLEWVELLGKWSLIDGFTMVLLMVAFHVHITTPDDGNATIPPGFAGVNALVTPQLGLIMILVPTLWSLVNSHILEHMHKVAVNHDEQNLPVKTDINSRVSIDRCFIVESYYFLSLRPFTRTLFRYSL